MKGFRWEPSRIQRDEAALDEGVEVVAQDRAIRPRKRCKRNLLCFGRPHELAREALHDLAVCFREVRSAFGSRRILHGQRER